MYDSYRDCLRRFVQGYVILIITVHLSTTDQSLISNSYDRYMNAQHCTQEASKIAMSMTTSLFIEMRTLKKFIALFIAKCRDSGIWYIYKNLAMSFNRRKFL